METSLLAARDASRIALCHWRAQTAMRGVVVIAHGLSEYAARYDRLASAMAAAGFEVYAHDHRGHGAAPVVRGDFGDTDGWQRVLGDLDTVIDHVRNRHPGRHVVLFGHSMGSFISRAYFLAHGDKLSGLVLSATGYRQTPLARVMRQTARLAGAFGGRHTSSAMMARLVFGSFNLGFLPTRTPLDWLSRDRDEVDRYIADPLCGFAPTPALWVDLFGGIIALERDERAARVGRGACRDLPVLIYAGSRDPVSLGKLALDQLARRYAETGMQDVTTRVYPGGRHEMHNETNRDEVVADLLRWIGSVTDRNPAAV